MTEPSTPSPITQADHDQLRDLADNGNETALDRLADLADERGDLDELNELLGEGCELAGSYLATRAVAIRDLRELQRLADEGIDQAEEALEQLLR